MTTGCTENSAYLVPLKNHQKLYQCGLCSVAFDLSILLCQHIGQHSLTKPYQCGYCKVSYDSNKELDSHVKTHALLLFLPSKAASGTAFTSTAPLSHKGGKPATGGTVDENQSKTTVPVLLIQTQNIQENGSTCADTKVQFRNRTVRQMLKDKLNAALFSHSGVNGSQSLSPCQLECVSPVGDVVLEAGTTQSLDRPGDTRHGVQTLANSQTQITTSQVTGSGKKRRGKQSTSENVQSTSENVQSTSGNVQSTSGNVQSTSENVPKVERFVESTAVKAEADDGDLACGDKPTVLGDMDFDTEDLAFGDNPTVLGDMDFDTEGYSEGASNGSSSPLSFVKIEYTDSYQQKNRPRSHVQPEMSLSVRDLEEAQALCNKEGKPDLDLQRLKNAENLAWVDDKYLPRSTIEQQTLNSAKGTLTLPRGNQGNKKDCLSCIICQKVFSSIKILKKHKKEVHPSYQRLPCSICGVTLKNKGSLYKHLRYVHGSGELFPCPSCPMSFKLEFLLKRHVMRVHSDWQQSYTEQTDEESTEDGMNSATTLESQHFEGNAPAHCPSCGKAFKNSKLVRKHQRDVHTSRQRLPCSLCRATLKNRDCLHKHMKLVHVMGRDFTCSICCKAFKTEPCLRNHLQRVHDSSLTHPCSVCGKLFRSFTSVLKHNALIHCTSVSYPCPFCSKVLKTRRLLRQHYCKERKEKEGVDVANKKRYPCLHCLWRFANLESLTEHMLTRHNLESCSVGGNSDKVTTSLSFCPYCTLKTAGKEQLLQHITEHHAELVAENVQDQRFRCQDCQRPFKTRTLLAMHRRRHTGEQPYLCDTCGQSFGLWNTYKSHINLHLSTKPLLCDICPRRFNSYSALTMHKRRHMGDKRYSCDVCGKLFYSSGMLKRHSVVHTSDRPLSCTLCDKTYRSLSSLKYHTTRHHSMQLAQ